MVMIPPLPKVSKPTNIAHLRPIRIFLSELVIIVHRQLIEYVEPNVMIPQYKSGFRIGHSTTSALLHLVDNIIRNLDAEIGTVLISNQNHLTLSIVPYF